MPLVWQQFVALPFLNVRLCLFDTEYMFILQHNWRNARNLNKKSNICWVKKRFNQFPTGIAVFLEIKLRWITGTD
jgi:hypothetical protein